VTAVEIKEVLPPRDILESMTKQMSAERTRRAVVLEASGQREAAVLRAEGQKQAAILEAEGARQGAILKAEGYALALGKVYEVAHTIDSRTLNLQYLETLKVLGQSPSTKWIMPLELSNLAQPFAVIAQGLGQLNGTEQSQNGKSQLPAVPTSLVTIPGQNGRQVPPV
jgi:regulator of protease activity HflC (stomatin/prohibitin superfamily)